MKISLSFIALFFCFLTSANSPELPIKHNTLQLELMCYGPGGGKKSKKSKRANKRRKRKCRKSARKNYAG
ncbi:MAG: hypothetical protein P8H43_03885 [Crocinitomicaceae bacterium]|jgi:hypothetical protein|nr:hypothetical protein [Crocinitomicaceae bacterium]MDA9881944.1 hypothetical protein [Crocinitomicaceae bacterium]MDB2479553.1 hypothetical protein [Crocinitomicaceae bacterium]MDG1036146.1 hypothetical protein [Crocinitomicaceae bacterium]MDG1741696.1 hypothetical protein [Crocinitomicaceae bacterium]